MRPSTLYFHGLPGSAAELAAFGPEIESRGAHLHVVTRSNAVAACPPADYFRRLAGQIAAQFPEGPLKLTGFSLGAAAALQVAPHLGARVAQIDLVSPAGPLGLGEFLDGMAGAPVFRAALAGRLPFAALTWVQAQVARIAPERMAAALMAGAQGQDRDLAADRYFIRHLAQSLRTSLIDQRAAYSVEILAYVTEWSAALAKVRQPVTIWQGSEDDWTPPAMAQALAAHLTARPMVLIQPGCSHFSALRVYLEEQSA